ncbi:MAG: HAD-IA family hydrolase [Pikeienuella sp.]|uniref:HAD-IA family hydrolase n=1 Tax=Pikeienuella sp. TaxID=2831957 RepID=UPI00391CAD95
MVARHDFARAAKARMLAEGRGDEPALGALFEAALEAAGVAEAGALAARLVAFEASVEAESMEVDGEAAETLAALAAAGKRLVAVSDMYLPEAALSALLERAGLLGRFERVFVSSEAGWTKKGGRLFPLVAASLGLPPERILHVGDRMEADVAPAEAAGMRAAHLLDRPRLAAREAARLAESWVPAPETRRARLRAAHGFAAEEALGSPEAMVDQLFGPAVGLLALRALAHARRTGARRLFHLSRDATIAGKVAAAAAAAHPWLAGPPEINELAVSRAQGALLTLGRAEDMCRLAHLLTYLTGQPPSAAAFRAAFGLEGALPGALERAEGEAFVAGIDDEAGALAALLAPARARLLTHLEGTGLFGEGGAVAVDIGYSGTFAAQLSALFMAEPARARRIDFLFLLTSRHVEMNLRRLHPAIRLLPGVALDHRRRAGRFAARNFAWAEPFLADPARGRLTGYDAAGAPLFAPPMLNEAAAAARRALRERLRARALRFVAEFPGGPGDAEELSALLQRRIARFAARPSGAEERALRALAHQTGQATLTAQAPTRLVNPFRIASELEALRLEDRWIGGSLRRSGLGLLALILADAPERDGRADPRAPWD